VHLVGRSRSYLLLACRIDHREEETPLLKESILHFRVKKQGVDVYDVFSTGITVQTYFSNNSQSQELANVQDAISKHVDGIKMYAASLSAESADVAAANAAHIPISRLERCFKQVQ
jgi:hypothetical protein